jgi:hypothetical protein
LDVVARSPPEADDEAISIEQFDGRCVEVRHASPSVIPIPQLRYCPQRLMGKTLSFRHRRKGSLWQKGEMIKISLFGKEGLREILIDYLQSYCFINSLSLQEISLAGVGARCIVPLSFILISLEWRDKVRVNR